MNRERILGIIRHVLTFGGGMAVSSGMLDAETLQTVVGASITLIGALWSVMAPEKNLT